jgi:hypothetical protein
MARKKKNGRLAMGLLETASDMWRVGILDSASHDKITRRNVERPGARAAKCHSTQGHRGHPVKIETLDHLSIAGSARKASTRR